MSGASTLSMSAADRLAQLGGEVGQVLSHARLERRRLGADRRRRRLEDLLPGCSSLLARAPIRCSSSASGSSSDLR